MVVDVLMCVGRKKKGQGSKIRPFQNMGLVQKMSLIFEPFRKKKVKLVSLFSVLSTLFFSSLSSSSPI